MNMKELQLATGEVAVQMVDHDERYYITSFGRVYSQAKKNPKYLSLYTCNGGYSYACIAIVSPEGKRKMKRFSVHRAVGHYFIDNPDPKTKVEINHIDGDKSNNKANNLEWVSSKENTAHSIRNGLRGDTRSGPRKLDAIKVLEIKKMLSVGISHKRISDLYKCGRKHITNISNGIRWSSITIED